MRRPPFGLRLLFLQELQESKKDSVALSMWSGAAVTKPGSKLLCETRVEGVANKDAGVDIDEENSQDGSPNWRFWRALPFGVMPVKMIPNDTVVNLLHNNTLAFMTHTRALRFLFRNIDIHCTLFVVLLVLSGKGLCLDFFVLYLLQFRQFLM
ncbi:uncharacterized protein LOC110011847 isoform X1 [Sesamum indicum]|uniref:Uncharacterized protein LOC110011847 isoform X1 n=1 Tax=Sesamum indicum TaxID=4182 RepID=A0A8M8UXT0_SESIN|nr:uncharacterized protein LOC110011847 isoform X1 [Sesamum indicum]